MRRKKGEEAALSSFFRSIDYFNSIYDSYLFFPLSAANQQFIVNGNGQISPIGQMYSTPMVMVPHSNTGQTQFVQQSSTALNRNVIQDSKIVQTAQATLTTATVSPPDTTTHSPKSPERSPSQKDGGNDINMVSRQYPMH